MESPVSQLSRGVSCIVAVLTMSAILSACGYKGPLYVPKNGNTKPPANSQSGASGSGAPASPGTALGTGSGGAKASNKAPSNKASSTSQDQTPDATTECPPAANNPAGMPSFSTDAVTTQLAQGTGMSSPAAPPDLPCVAGDPDNPDNATGTGNRGNADGSVVVTPSNGKGMTIAPTDPSGLPDPGDTTHTTDPLNPTNP